MLTGFVKIRENYYAWNQILSVLKVSGSEGKDGQKRTRVIRITPEAAGSLEPKHCAAWATEEEAADVLEQLEKYSSQKTEAKC